MTGAPNIISGNDNRGILIQGVNATGNKVQGNYIGTDVDGTTDLGNAWQGVEIWSPSNVVGGSIEATRNVISGNHNRGVLILGAAQGGNALQGNYIGTDYKGTSGLGNAWQGVQVIDSPGNTIGGETFSTGNVISSNGIDGITIVGANATKNLVEANRIGTDKSGTHPLGNHFAGVAIFDGASKNTIGGTAAGAGNVVSANGNKGFYIAGGGTTGNLVQRNLIGTDASGTIDLGNAVDGITILDGAHDNIVGGSVGGAGNVIAANALAGIALLNSPGNRVQGNFIGTNSANQADIGNHTYGVLVQDSSGSTIGGTVDDARNVISNNGIDGVTIIGARSTGNLVVKNFIGTDVGGTHALGNHYAGVAIFNGASKNTIGGVSGSVGNVISGNRNKGVYIANGGTTGNVLLGNYIGTDRTAMLDVGNASDGVTVTDGASGNFIGSTFMGAGNTIAHSTGRGVGVDSGTNNSILSNAIFANAGLGIDLGNDGVTTNDTGDGDAGANNLQNFPVVQSVRTGQFGTIIQGMLNGTPNASILIQFFVSAATDPTGFGEGEALIATTFVSTDRSGNTTYSVLSPSTVPIGRFITATATDPLREYLGVLGVSSCL